MKKPTKKPVVGVHYALLAALREGDTFELGVPFSFSLRQPFQWLCTGVITETDGRSRVQLRLSFRGVLLRELVARLNPSDKSVEWEDV